MDLALETLHSCHLRSNSGQCRARSTRAQASAAAASAPITLAQRMLLQAAARRARSSQQRQQQQQQQSQQQQLLLQQQQQQQEPGRARAMAPPIPQQQPVPQHILPQELQLHAEMLQQLINSREDEFHQLMERHQRQQHQRLRQQHHPRPTPMARQQHVSPPPLPNQPATVSPPEQLLLLQQQQQQLLQQGQEDHNRVLPEAAAGQHAPPTPHMEQLQQQQLLQRHLALRQLIQQQRQRQRQLQLQLRREPAVLTALIKRSSSWQRLQQLFASFTPLFNPVHVSAAITHLAQLQHAPLSPQQLDAAPEGFRRLVRDLTAAAVACIPDFGPRQLANSLWALSRLGAGGLVPRRLRGEFLAAFAQRLDGAAPQHVANVAAAVASMGWPTSTEWRQQLLQAAAAKVEHFKPQELALLLHALPRLLVQPSPEWLARFAAACHAGMHGFTLQELAMLGTSLAKLQHTPERGWLLLYLQAVQLQLQQCIAAEAAAVAEAANGLHYAGQGLVSVLWAVAAWGAEVPAHWCDGCLAAAEHLVGGLTIQGTSTLLWALARLQVRPDDALLRRLLEHSYMLLPQANATDLAMLAWGLGTLGVTAAELSELVPAASSSGDGGGSSSSSSSSTGDASRWLGDFMYHSFKALPSATAVDVATLLVGLQRMQLKPGARYVRAVAVEVSHRLHAMNAVQLSSTLLCLVRWGHTPSAAFLAAYSSCTGELLTATAAAPGSRSRQAPLQRQRRPREHGSPLLAAAAAAAGAPQDAEAASAPLPPSPHARGAASQLLVFNPQGLANMLGALALLGHRPSQQWSSAFLAAARALLPRFAGRDFAYVLWGLALLEVQPGQAWLDALLLHLRAHVPAMTSQQLSAVVWGLARLNHRPGADFMHRFLDRVVALTPPPLPRPTTTSTSSGASSSSSSGSVAFGGSHHGEARGPPSPLQLSGYFSAIILQGLTAWAAARLEDAGGASGGGLSESGSAGTPLAHGRRSAPHARRQAGTRRAEPEGLAVAQQPREDGVAALGPLNMPAAGHDGAVTTRITQDGAVVYHF